MALTLSRKNPRGSVGLDLDGAFVAAVQTQDGRISRAASMELPSGVISDGEVTDVERLSESLKTFFKENDLPTRVRFGVSNQQIVVRHLELPKIDESSELGAAVRFQAAEAIAMPLDEAVLDYQVVGEATSPEGTPRLRIVVVAARQAMIERFVEGVRGAGLKPEGIDLNAFALVRALAKPVEDAPAPQGSSLGAPPPPRPRWSAPGPSRSRPRPRRSPSRSCRARPPRYRSSSRVCTATWGVSPTSPWPSAPTASSRARSPRTGPRR